MVWNGENSTVGRTALATLTANSAATSATTELTVATSPAISFDGATLVEVSFNWSNVSLTVSTDVFFIRLYDGGTQIAQWALVGANTGGGHIRSVATPSAGSHTYTARLVRFSGTGTGTLAAGATSPAHLLAKPVLT